MEGSNGKRKKGVSHTDYGTKCICSDPRCAAASKKIAKYEPDGDAFFSLPMNPKPESEMVNKPTGQAKASRDARAKRRERMLKALPPAATIRANDPRYKKGTQFKIHASHFPRQIRYLVERNGSRPGANLPLSISVELKNQLHSRGLAYTDADKFDDGTFVPLPNVPISEVESYAGELEEAYADEHEDTIQPAKRQKTRSSRDEFDLRRSEHIAAGAVAREKLAKQREKATAEALQKRIDELTSQNLKLRKRVDELKTELIKVKQGHEVFEYGLSRSNFLSNKWHEANPRAAKHFFGFKDWKETVDRLHALFGVRPPTEIPSKTTPISPFEKYLMGYLRVHTKISVYTIGRIWGRDDGHVGRLIGTTVDAIGVAAKIPPNVDNTPEYAGDNEPIDATMKELVNKKRERG